MSFLIVPVDIETIRFVSFIFTFYIGLLTGIVASLLIVKRVEDSMLKSGKEIVEVVFVNSPTKKHFKALLDMRKGESKSK